MSLKLAAMIVETPLMLAVCHSLSSCQLGDANQMYCNGLDPYSTLCGQLGYAPIPSLKNINDAMVASTHDNFGILSKGNLSWPRCFHGLDWKGFDFSPVHNTIKGYPF